MNPKRSARGEKIFQLLKAANRDSNEKKVQNVVSVSVQAENIPKITSFNKFVEHIPVLPQDPAYQLLSLAEEVVIEEVLFENATIEDLDLLDYMDKTAIINKENFNSINICDQETGPKCVNDSVPKASNDNDSCDSIQNIHDEFEKTDTDEDTDYVPNDVELESASNEEDAEATEEETKAKYAGKEETKGILKRKKGKSKRQKVKALKNLGKEYLNSKGCIIEERRMLPNPCAGKKCLNKCNSFLEMERKEIFEYYWKLGDSNKQKAFLSECVGVKEVKRRRKSTRKVFRRISNDYFLKKNNNVQFAVCQQFLIKTLNITQRLIRTVIANKDLSKFPKQDSRGSHESAHKITTDQLAFLDNFIKSLPTVPSHYCRSSTSKTYLPAEVKSISNLHRSYLDTHAKSGNKSFPPLKKCMFIRLFKSKYNIGIHVPRKDKCIKCDKYKNLGANRSDADKQAFEEHIKDKDEVKKEFLEQQSASVDNGTLVATLDLQKVLATPHGNTMTLGFSRKYAVYNFTVYETKTRRGFCFVWGEKDGKRGSNEIASNLFIYLQQLDSEKTFKKISLFCDNCAGQNKNKAIFAMIRYFLDTANHVEEIDLTFLITGHTYMPVDSMHAIIEKFTKKTIVQAPSEWPTILRNCRKQPFAYVVKKLIHTDFLDFKGLNLASPMKIKISSVKSAFFFKCTSVVRYTTSFKDPIEKNFDLQIRGQTKPFACYKTELGINKQKYKDLKRLCESHAIEPQFHLEYLTLKTNPNVPDVLNESDADDDLVENGNE